MLRTSEGLRHISNGAASSCLSGRQLQVKFAHNRYEFFESGGGTCGNFVIVRVSSVNAAQSLTIDGGHYAVVNATANGQTTSSVGLYTLSGLPLDSRLANAISHGGIGSSTKVIHGVFTYNWQSIINALKKPDGTLRRPLHTAPFNKRSYAWRALQVFALHSLCCELRCFIGFWARL